MVIPVSSKLVTLVLWLIILIVNRVIYTYLPPHHNRQHQTPRMGRRWRGSPFERRPWRSAWRISSARTAIGPTSSTECRSSRVASWNSRQRPRQTMLVAAHLPRWSPAGLVQPATPTRTRPPQHTTHQCHHCSASLEYSRSIGCYE